MNFLHAPRILRHSGGYLERALQTRRGSGYYKVPSLRGVWYGGPFEHNGFVATPENWFDERSLRDHNKPTGFAGVGITTRAVPGHEFGFRLRIRRHCSLF
jgi:hypothetical protein